MQTLAVFECFVPTIFARHLYFYEISLDVSTLCLVFIIEFKQKWGTEVYSVYEPPRGKTNNLHRRKQRREADQRLCFTRIAQQFLFYLIRNLKLLALFCDCTGRFVSDLFGNHIVGFPTRRLILYKT